MHCHHLACNVCIALPRKQSGYARTVSRLVALAIFARAIVPCSARNLRSPEAEVAPSQQAPNAVASPALVEESEEDISVGDTTPPEVPMMHPLLTQLSVRSTPLSTAPVVPPPVQSIDSEIGDRTAPLAPMMNPLLPQPSFRSSRSVAPPSVKYSGIVWDSPLMFGIAHAVAPATRAELPQLPSVPSFEVPTPVLQISAQDAAAQGIAAVATGPSAAPTLGGSGDDTSRTESALMAKRNMTRKERHKSALMAYRQRMRRMARIREEREKVARRLIIHVNKFAGYSHVIHPGALFGSMLLGCVFMGCLNYLEIIVK